MMNLRSLIFHWRILLLKITEWPVILWLIRGKNAHGLRIS